MIYFKNEGVIDLRAMTTFGVSVKEGENPIGFFGTGFKYAVSIILRLGGNVTVWRGKRQYKFGVKRVKIRGEEFNMVTLGNKELGFTTDVGKTWEAWQAYRELHCNTQDEGGTITDAETQPETGATLVVVDCIEILRAYLNRSETFLETEPKYTSPEVEIHEQSGDGIYYRGIKVGEHERQAIFTYNCISPLALTEDRGIKYTSEPDAYIRRSVVHSDNEEYITAFVCAPLQTMEQRMDIDYGDRPSATFMKVLAESSWVDVTNESAKELHRKNTVSTVGPKRGETNAIEEMQLKKAVDFCAGLGYNIEQEIIITDDLPDSTLGMMYRKEIYIARRTFMMGTKMVAATVFEEWIHLTKHLPDESYAMQNFLFELVITLGERINGEPL